MKSVDLDKWKLIESGIFDADFYVRHYSDSPVEAENALAHFMLIGLDQNRLPNFYFDPDWYCRAYASQLNGRSAIEHFVHEGDAQGCNPGEFFDTEKYRSKYGISRDKNCLGHYIQNKISYKYSPVDEFDIEYYCYSNRDVVHAKMDAFEHFVAFGYSEGREPSRTFKTKYYIKKYLNGSTDHNPFLHFLRHRGDGVHFGAPPPENVSVHREIKRFSKPGPDFEEIAEHGVSGQQKLAAVLAFYLPQFHQISENDAWWGAGFTEWTNIARGVPRFAGHYQPRVPRDLGFYDLSDVSNLIRQIELAKNSGLSGFVYYYYNFNGKRLLEKPLEALLENADIDFPFCLMWANENWTKRWDGEDKHVLIAQDYNSLDEAALIADFARHFKDPRYIRLNGRPLLMIYRADVVPDIRNTLARWRTLFGETFGEDPIIVTAQAFNNDDPRQFGADGAIEFPPHKLTGNLAPIQVELDYLDDEFAGKVYRYEDVVNVSLADMDPPFPLIKTVVPSWDNDARLQGNGLVVTGSTPAKYQEWLERLVHNARAKPFFGTPLVCVNAWNEWCEGAYLEPDQHFGSAYLNATARAVCARREPGSTILLVGHDAFPSGAQHLLLNIGKAFKRDFGFRVEFLLLGPGAMEQDYRAVGPTQVLAAAEDLNDKLGSGFLDGIDFCIVNTLASSQAVALLAEFGLNVTLLVHEMPSMIRKMNLAPAARVALGKAQCVVFAAPAVRDAVCEELQIDVPATVKILPQGCYKPVARDPIGGNRIRVELGVPDGASLVVGVGYADLRKGFDLFLQLWRSISRLDRSAHMAWVGDIDPDLRIWLDVEIAEAVASGRFHLGGYRDDVQDWLNAADIFALTSREDPFPSVVLEALSAGLPVYAFDNTGGMPHFLRSNNFGVVVPHADVQAMANAMRLRLGRTAEDADRERLARACGGALGFARYSVALKDFACPTLAKISVAVPNYNYGHYLDQRLGGIFAQSHPVHEILVLDDCSTDDSLAELSKISANCGRMMTICRNEQNSGSVFAQWRRVAETAEGEYLWIAEADDDSDPSFLSEMIAVMARDQKIVMGFCDSASIDDTGQAIWPDYQEYYNSVEAGGLAHDAIFDGRDFVRRFLSIKNLILNVSAVVWRRNEFLQALNRCEKELIKFQCAGDWRIYADILLFPGAKLVYRAKSLNFHRRHAGGVTKSINASEHLSEIMMCHSFINSKISLPEIVKAKQSVYLNGIFS